MRTSKIILMAIAASTLLTGVSCSRSTITTTTKSVEESSDVGFLMPKPMRERISELKDENVMSVYYEAVGPTKEIALVSAETGARAKLSENYTAQVEVLKDKYVGDVNMEASTYMAEAINILSTTDLSMSKIDDMYTMVSKVDNKSNGDSQQGYSVKVIAYLDVDDIMNQIEKSGKDKQTMQQAREMFAKLKNLLLKK